MLRIPDNPEVKLEVAALLMNVFKQEQLTRRILGEMRLMRFELGRILGRMRHNKTQEPIHHV